ncbi:MAG: outer membrane protein assembly factor BamD [Acidobacteriota bacterium]|nr:outer membrane protein assembly factor BamD [Acidobacteriota bacterium]
MNLERLFPFSRTLRRASIVLLISVVFLPGCILHRHHISGLPVAPGEQPDKILLDKSLNEFKHGRYQTGRLLLQSLINTYPDSEYLSQAKLAIADSYYKQGGISGLTEAEAEYKDFITFFPTAPEAPMAEYRAGMCHYRLVGKADRDPEEALQAEAEFKLFLMKYPSNPLMPEVKGRLREVQEVLAQGNYEIAMFYYNHRAYLASESRLKDIVNKYPNFSRGDDVFWYLGQSLAELHKPRESIPYYDRLIMEFPLSNRVDDAKGELASLHAPIPTPTQAMLARAEADAVRHGHPGLLRQTIGAFGSSPDYSSTLHGPVILGSTNTIQAQIAKLDNPPAEAKTANNISVQTGNSASLAAGKAVDPDSSAKPAAASAESKQAAAKPSDNPPPTRQKEGKLHFLKKMIP